MLLLVQELDELAQQTLTRQFLDGLKFQIVVKNTLDGILSF